MKTYMCIDLKSFYASVECVERGLDPFKTPLVVADKSRGEGTIVLAASPYIKTFGVPSRCRLFEIPKNISMIIAKPRMKKYIDYSAKVYNIFLSYFSKDDIHVYSIDESFIDVTPYLNYYHKSAYELANEVLNKIYSSLKLTATCGIGENMFLCKVALDILAKHAKDGIKELSKEEFYQTIWFHSPLTDIWSIGPGLTKRLNKLGCNNLHDIAYTKEQTLLDEFGIIGHDLYEHAWGCDNTTINDIKMYTPQNRSLSKGQILFRDYTKAEAQTIFIEMLDDVILDMVNKRLKCKNVSFFIGYSKNTLGGVAKSISLDSVSMSFNKILDSVLPVYNECVLDLPIRTIHIVLSNFSTGKIHQLSLFEDEECIKKEENLIYAMAMLKENYGKNAVLRGISYCPESNIKMRNTLIGGHNGE